MPSVDPDIDTTLLSNLNTSDTITLGYSYGFDLGSETSANITFSMVYPAIALEHTSLVSQVSCSSLYLTLVANSHAAYNAINAWPDQDVALITKSTGCNSDAERGVYLITATSSNASSSTFTFRIRNVTWTDVATTMEVSYGTINRPRCTDSSASPTAFSPTYTNSPSYDDLSEPARQIVDYISSRITRDDSGNILLYTPPQTNLTMAAQDYQPDNTTLQNALADALDAAGLDSPEDLIAQARDSLGGSCGASNGSGSNSTSTNATEASAPQKRNLYRRFGWDDAWDIGCSDLVGAFTGDVGEAVCDAKDVYDSRDAIACLFSSCYTQVSNPPPPSYMYDFLYSWTASFFFPRNSAVVSFSDGSALNCIDCSYTISELKIQGKITAVLATGEIKGAAITVSENSVANMYFGLNTRNALSYNWAGALSTSNLDSITVQNVFNINPKIIFSMGAEFSTSGAVDIEAGSGLTLSGASADIDLGTAFVSNTRGWTPSTNINNPAFSSAGHVEFYPYMRRMVEIGFSVMGNAINNKATLTSQTTLGFVAEVDDTPGFCTADQMHLQTYLGTSQNLVFDSGQKRALYSNSDKMAEKCFNVPSTRPTRDEINSLAQVGADFCTAYVGYRAPVSGFYTAATVTVPTTRLVTNTTTFTSTPTTTVTTDVTATRTRVVLTEASVTEAAAGTQSLGSQYLKRDFVYASMTQAPTTTPRTLKERAATMPDMISTWDPTKISYACSQIATGTITRTVTTGTSTVTSGTVTAYTTTYALAGGVPVTEVSTISHYEWATSTRATASATFSSSCPLQTQETCFTLTGHGRPSVEGKKLNVKSGLTNPVFDDQGTTFYLTCDKSLVSLPDLRVLDGPLGSLNDTQLTFVDDWASANTSGRAQCTQDVVSKELSCFLSSLNSNLMYIWEPITPYWDGEYYRASAYQDTRVNMPVWDVPAGAEEEYLPIYMTYEEAACTCGSLGTPTIDHVDTTNPSCPGDDGTLFTTSDGTDWQIQCGIDYTGNELSSTSFADLGSCINGCNGVTQCVGVTWSPSSQTCSYKSYAVTPSYPSTPVYAAVRIGGNPGVALASPTAIAGDVVNGAPNSIDDDVFSVTLPFAIGVYGQMSANIVVTSNGVIGIPTANAEYTNYALPYSSVGATAVLAYWDDTYIYSGTAQGIYYEVAGTTGSRTVTFEFYLSHFQAAGEYYHYLVKFYEDRPGAVTINYLIISDSGSSATVGVQSGSSKSI